MFLQLIIYSKSYHVPHMWRRKGSACRGFTQDLAPKFWFWFGSFLGKVYHHYRYFLYADDPEASWVLKAQISKNLRDLCQTSPLWRPAYTGVDLVADVDLVDDVEGDHHIDD